MSSDQHASARAAHEHARTQPVKFLNLTPHDVVVIDDTGPTMALPPTGTVARVVDDVVGTAWLQSREHPNAAPLRISEFGGSRPGGLPPARDGVILVASRVVVAQHPERRDLMFPHPLVRDEHGSIMGCSGFARWAETTSTATHDDVAPQTRTTLT